MCRHDMLIQEQKHTRSYCRLSPRVKACVVWRCMGVSGSTQPASQLDEVVPRTRTQRADDMYCGLRFDMTRCEHDVVHPDSHIESQIVDAVALLAKYAKVTGREASFLRRIRSSKQDLLLVLVVFCRFVGCNQHRRYTAVQNVTDGTCVRTIGNK
jgi:hypothetical protein